MMKAVTADILWGDCLLFAKYIRIYIFQQNCPKHVTIITACHMTCLVGTLVWRNGAYNGTKSVTTTSWKGYKHKERCSTNKQKDELKLSLRANIYTLYL